MKCLIVVDMQNDFITGSLGTPQAQAIVPLVVEKVRSFGGEIIFTRDTHQPNYLDTLEGRKLPVEHCIKETAGWQICAELEKPAAGCKVINKPTFGSEALAAYLKSLHSFGAADVIELVGLCTDICVISNALLLKAFFPETAISVDARCCAGVTPQSHENALAAMEICQIEVMR